MSQNLAISNIQVNGQSISTEPFSILTGELFDVGWTVSNLGDQPILGDGNSATHFDTVYLSDDDVLSLDDVLVGSYNGTTSLGANPDSYNRSQRVSISTNVLWWQSPLNKYLIFQTNSSGSVTESDQTDNIVLIPITISSIDLSLEYATVSFAGNGSGGGGIAADSLAAATVGSGAPVNIVAGQSINLSWQVRNIGNVDANTGYTDRVYLSKDAVLDANDLSLLTVSRNSLLSNQSYNGYGSVSVPTGIFGSAYILFDTDGNKQVAEGDESNNLYAAPVFVVGDPPDLTVTSVTAPTEANIGQAITVSWTVNNSGLGATYTPWYDKVYLSDDSILGADDQDLTYRYNADALGAGASYSQNNIQVYLPSNAAGSKYLLFATDEIVNFYAASLSTSSINNIGNLFESNEANNVFAQQINIKAPDLSPVSLLSSTTTTALGSAINVGWSVKNQGQVATTRTWYDRLVLSDDMAYDSSDIALAETYQNSTLGTNESYQVGLDAGGSPTRQVFIPTNIKGGSKYLLLVNDVYHSQGELNETNNIAALAINIAAPDLVITNATAPTTAIIGENILVNWTVQNSGNSATSNPYWYDRIYVSSDLTLDAQDTYLGNRYNSQPLAVNGSYGVVGNSVNITNTALGDRYLLFVANYGKEQGELNFNNNTYAVPITLTAPDLVVSQVSTLANAAVGDSITVNWSVKNQGAVSTSVGSWYDQVYLSDDKFLGNDISLGSFYRDNSSKLGADAEYNSTANIILPSYSVGNKYILVVTDAYNNYQSETNENNNFKFTSTPISIAAPNLTLTATAPAITTLGQATSVTWTVNNASGTTANTNWYDRVYLSSDQNLDSSDTLLTSESINAQTPISGGGQYSVTKNVTITGNNVGNRYLIFAADRDANQIETNETDNQFVVPITVVTNDLRADSVTTNNTVIEFGNLFDITWAVTNIGVGNTGGTWGDRIFLSHDNILSADDIAISTQNKTANLFTDNSYSTTASVKVERTNPLPVDANGFVSEVEQNDSIAFAQT
jgi:subtilase family serine protease